MHRQLLFTVAASSFVLMTTSAHADVTYYPGALNDSDVAPAFVSATATHSTQLIDFDDDGFDLEGNEYTPIPSNHYADLGVSIFNMDARSVTNPAWTHSPPVGAWQTGFDAQPASPYAFEFASPVASFGLFANDVEAPVTVTIHHGNESQTVTWPFQGSSTTTQFHGFVSDANNIERIDFSSTDYHVIDDVQFGYVPEPAAASAMLALAIAMCRRKAR